MAALPTTIGPLDIPCPFCRDTFQIAELPVVWEKCDCGQIHANVGPAIGNPLVDKALDDHHAVCSFWAR